MFEILREVYLERSRKALNDSFNNLLESYQRDFDDDHLQIW